MQRDSSQDMADKTAQQDLHEIKVQVKEVSNPFEMQDLSHQMHMEQYNEAIKDRIERVTENLTALQDQIRGELLSKQEKGKPLDSKLDLKVQIAVEREISDRLHFALDKDIIKKKEDEKRRWLVFVGSTFCMTGQFKKTAKYIGYRTKHFNIFVVLL